MRQEFSRIRRANIPEACLHILLLLMLGAGCTLLIEFGAAAAPTVINNVNDLENITNNLSGDYVLGGDIDASVTAGWNGGRGFIPIGSALSGVLLGNFSGTLNGQGHIISNLTINTPLGIINGQAGLIEQLTGSVTNLGITNARVSGSSAGIVTGSNLGGTVSHVYTTGTVSGLGSGFTPSIVGGLVGVNANGTINQSYSGAAVTFSGFGDAGGLAGWNTGSITQSYSTGNVTGGTGSNDVGGIVGANLNNGVISQTYAVGSLSGSSGTSIGGIAGTNQQAPGPTIISSYWDKNTTGANRGVGFLTSGTLTNVTGLTTSVLQAGALPTGFDPTIWKAAPSQYPTLQSQLTSSHDSFIQDFSSLQQLYVAPGPMVTPQQIRANQQLLLPIANDALSNATLAGTLQPVDSLHIDGSQVVQVLDDLAGFLDLLVTGIYGGTSVFGIQLICPPSTNNCANLTPLILPGSFRTVRASLYDVFDYNLSVSVSTGSGQFFNPGDSYLINASALGSPQGFSILDVLDVNGQTVNFLVHDVADIPTEVPEPLTWTLLLFPVLVLSSERNRTKLLRRSSST